ncbi:MAG: CxxC-x17-CxxC domain-containing protein [Patescibacteria group bacterium]|jgi:CxxC-x17-CxxC domain-containing protein
MKPFHHKNPKFGGKKRSGDFSKMTHDRSDRSSRSKEGYKKFGGRDYDPAKATKILHEAVCAECHEACKVPFKPNGKKPILCHDCFKKSDSYDSRKPAQYNKSFQHTESYKRDFEQINKKLDKILQVLEQ